MADVGVLLEEGRRRTFASALDWPGWARAARTPDDALGALASYRDRYADVLARGGVDAPTGRLVVRAHVDGDATTDFGAPSIVVELDRRTVRRVDADRLTSCVTASWRRFDEVAYARGALRAGPRGGGRSREKIARHVTDAEVAYARGLGLRTTATDGDRDAIDALRARLLAVLDGSEASDRDARWPRRYGARRVAWHVLDHVFEIEDRSSR